MTAEGYSAQKKNSCLNYCKFKISDVSLYYYFDIKMNIYINMIPYLTLYTYEYVLI
jgi:hypothetical protein